MKLIYKSIHLKVFGILLLVFLIACSKDDNQSITYKELSKAEEDALIFMIEEEKLALDTYTYLDAVWGIPQFLNIKKSEQNHVQSVSNLIDSYNLPFTMLPPGLFANQELQNYYKEFIVLGSTDQLAALTIGATIEDMDIVDLETLMKTISDPEIRMVFENLQCGSRNHLRAFNSAIERINGNYSPQFLTLEAFNAIIESSNERCN